jgi:hypothetical protein
MTVSIPPIISVDDHVIEPPTCGRYDIGIDVITFECDYPHQDSTWPNTPAYAEKILGDLPEEEVFKVVRGNALDLFGLDPELDGQTGL